MEGEYGVPTAPMVTARFADYVIRDGHSHGMNLRWTFPPYPVAWVPRETLREYINGDDPVTGVKLMTEVIDALTKPLTEAEKNPEIADLIAKIFRATAIASQTIDDRDKGISAPPQLDKPVEELTQDEIRKSI